MYTHNTHNDNNDNDDKITMHKKFFTFTCAPTTTSSPDDDRVACPRVVYIHPPHTPWPKQYGYARFARNGKKQTRSNRTTDTHITHNTTPLTSNCCRVLHGIYRYKQYIMRIYLYYYFDFIFPLFLFRESETRAKVNFRQP